MEVKDLISEDLIELGQSAAEAADAIRALGGALSEQGYIRAAYTENVLEREREYPTGIALVGGGIAIPHATPDGDVLENGIAALQLARPVEFHGMENAEDTIEAHLVFMLALKDPNEHLALLKKLFGMFQTESVMETLRHTADKRNFKDILTAHLK